MISRHHAALFRGISVVSQHQRFRIHVADVKPSCIESCEHRPDQMQRKTNIGTKPKNWTKIASCVTVTSCVDFCRGARRLAHGLLY